MGRSDSQELINAAASYVGSAIPWPSRTEGRFWTATAMATTGKRKDWRRLVTISAQNAEVLVLGEVTTNAGSSVEGFINIDKNVTGIESWIRQRRLKARLGAGTYGTIGEVGRIEFSGTTAVAALLTDDGPVGKSAKTLALNLMRKGPSMYSRFHNDHLADAIFHRLANME